MKLLYEVLKAKTRISINYIISVKNESKVKVSVITFFTIMLWFGIYRLVYFLCSKLIRYTGLETGIEFIGYLFATFTVLVFYILIFSNIIVAYSTLYKSKETIFLFQKPIDFKKIFLIRFFESLSFSSWALAFLGVPVVLALGVNFKASIFFYPIAIFYFFPFVIISASLGTIITMLLVRIFPGQKRKFLVFFASVWVIAFIYYLKNVFQSTKVEEGIFLVNFLQELSSTRSEWLPSYWLSKGMMAFAIGSFEVSFKYLFFLAGAAILLLFFAYKISGIFYYDGWTRLLGQDILRIRLPGKSPFKLLKILDVFIKNPLKALFIKDIKLFWRDPTQWTQFVIFFGIIGIYYTYLGSISYHKNLGVMKNYIGFLNVGFISMILSTLTSRFVFPLISLEGQRFWILGLAPISLKKLLWQKFWLSVFSTSIFTVTLILFSGLILKLNIVDLIQSLYLIVINVLTLSALAVGLGALYPNFKEDNVARIVSGLGGTLNFLISIIYIFIVIFLQIKFFQVFLLKKMKLLVLMQQSDIFFLVIITLISALFLFVPMRLGLKNLKNLDF